MLRSPRDPILQRRGGIGLPLLLRRNQQITRLVTAGDLKPVHALIHAAHFDRHGKDRCRQVLFLYERGLFPPGRGPARRESFQIIYSGTSFPGRQTAVIREDPRPVKITVPDSIFRKNLLSPPTIVGDPLPVSSVKSLLRIRRQTDRKSIFRRRRIYDDRIKGLVLLTSARTLHRAASPFIRMICVKAGSCSKLLNHDSRIPGAVRTHCPVAVSAVLPYGINAERPPECSGFSNFIVPCSDISCSEYSCPLVSGSIIFSSTVFCSTIFCSKKTSRWNVSKKTPDCVTGTRLPSRDLFHSPGIKKPLRISVGLLYSQGHLCPAADINRKPILVFLTVFIFFTASVIIAILIIDIGSDRLLTPASSRIRRRTCSRICGRKGIL